MFGSKALIRELDKNTQYVCCNCLVPAAAMIAYRMPSAPGRLCGNHQIIEVENYTTAALLKRMLVSNSVHLNKHKYL